MERVVRKVRARFARHLRGRGLEIGALHNPLAIPNASEIVYSDLLTAEQLAVMYPGSRPPDIVSDSESFPGVDDDTFDFVVANHVLEHLTDPIGALREWHRILRDGGLLYLAVPDKRFTFDHRRRRTPLQHLVDDHHSDLDPQARNRAHLLDWAEHVEGFTPGSDAFERWVDDRTSESYSVHNHVWVAQDVVRLMLVLADRFDARFALRAWKNASPLRNEFLLLVEARKRSSLGDAERRAWSIALAVALAEHPLLETAAIVRRLVRTLRGRDRAGLK